MNAVYFETIAKILGSLKAASDDCEAAQIDLSAACSVDAQGGIDTALHHAQEAVSRLKLLQSAMRGAAL